MRRQNKYLYILFFISNLFFSANAQLQKTNIPTVYITTENNAPVREKETWVKGHIIVKSSDPAEELDMAIEIRGRGNSTWRMAKKPYRIKLDKKTRFLNLPAKEKNWVFLANYSDKSLLRNAVAFRISSFIGLEFTPSVRFVDLVLNDVYVGNYMVSDQIEVVEKRVPVEKQTIADENIPEITGGYLLEIDGFADSEPVWFSTGKGMKITVKYPKNDEINNQQLNYIKNFTADFERRLFSADFNDPEKGYRNLVDTLSLINWYIACELTGNSDSFWSTYIYKYRNIDKFYFGPLWDFDIAFNNDNRLGDATLKLMRQHAHDYKIWIQQLWRDEWFRKAVNNRWKSLIAAGIEEELMTYIDDFAALIDQSQGLNYKKWGKLNERVYLEQYLFRTYEENVSYLKTYLTKRIKFLTESFESSLVIGSPFEPENYYYTILNKRSGNAVEVQGGSLQENANLWLWNLKKNDQNQQWLFISKGNQKYNIVNRHSGLAMTSNGWSNSLIQAKLNNTKKIQQWEVVDLDGGIYALENVATGFCIDNCAGGFDNGTAAIEYSNEIYSNENQQWLLYKSDPLTVIEEVSGIEGNIRLITSKEDGYIYIEFLGPIESDLNISIYNITGTCIFNESLSKNNSGIIPVPVKKHSFGQNGVCMIRISSEGKSVYSGKLIVN